MHDPILHQLDQLQTRLKRLVCLRGTFFAAVISLALLIVLGLIDFGYRFQWPLWRWSASVLFWSSVGISIAMFLVRPLVRRVSRVQLALWLDERIDWNGELAAATAFVESSRDGVEASQLSSDVVERVRRRLSGYQADRLVPRIQLWAWEGGVILALATCVGFATVLPVESYFAAARILWPASAVTWPSRVRLEILDHEWNRLRSDKIAVSVNAPLELLIRDQVGAAPHDILLESIHASGKRNLVRIRAESRRSPAGAEEIVFPVSVIPEPGSGLQIRAFVDGESGTSWITLIRTVPPGIREWRIDVESPAYLDLPIQTYDNLVGSLPAVIGSRVHVTGRLSTAVATVFLRHASQAPQASEAISGDRFQFEIAVNDAGPEVYAVHASGNGREDESWESIPRLRRFEIVGTADQPPIIELTQRSGTRTVTARARIPLQIVARDDFSIHQIELLVRTGSAGSQETWKSLSYEEQRPSLIENEFVLPLEEIEGVSSELCFVSSRARDAFEHERWAESPALQFRVVTEEEKVAEIETAIALLLDKIDFVAEQQAQVQTRTQTLLDEFVHRAFPEGGLDRLGQIADAQSEIRAELVDGQQGVLARVRDLIVEFEVNQLAGEGLTQTLAAMRENVTDLDATCLLPARDGLGRLTRLGAQLAEASLRPLGSVSPEELLQTIIDVQEETLTRLRALLTIAERSVSRHDLERDWELLVDRFQTAHEGLVKLGRQTVSRALADLSPTERESLTGNAAEHEQLAQQASRFVIETHANAASGSALEDAANVLAAKDVSIHFQEAAIRIRRNNVISAVEIDQQIAHAFAQAAESVSQASSSGAHVQLVATRDALEEVHRIQHGVEVVHLDWQSAQNVKHPPERQLALGQISVTLDDWAGAVQSLGTRLRFHGLSEAAAPLNEAGTRLRTLKRDLFMLSNVELEREFENAEAILERSVAVLERLAGQLERAVRAGEVTTLGQHAGLLAEAQDRIRNAVAELSRNTERRVLTRRERSEVDQLRQRQSTLSVDVHNLKQQLAEFPVFALALDFAQQDMDRAATLLGAAQIGQDVTRLQSSASNRLRDLTASVQLDAPKTQTPGDSAFAEDSEGFTSELSLLIRMQERLIEREETVLSEPNVAVEESRSFFQEQQRINNLIEAFLESSASVKE